MAIFLTLESTVLSAIAACLIFLSLFLLISRYGQTKNKNAHSQAPEAGGAWPLIGHLHLFGGPEPTHRILGNMADKYGPIFTMKMGVNRALVVSNSEITKECFTTNDKAFASRPSRMAMEILGYNFLATPSSPYGSYWRETRKIATVELLSNHRLEKLKHVRESEVKASIKGLFEDCQNSTTGKVSVEMKHWLEGTTFDIIIRIIAGKRYTSQEGTDLHEHAASFFTLFGKFVVSDALPFLRWLDIGGNEKLMKQTAKEFDIILQQWLDEHKIKRGSSEVKGDEDFIYVMLSLLCDNTKQLPHSDADTVIKALCLVCMIMKNLYAQLMLLLLCRRTILYTP